MRDLEFVDILLRSGGRDWWTEWLSSLHSTPKSRQSAPVAETVDDDDGHERASAKVKERRVPTEDSGVAKLEERSQDRWKDWGIWMR